MTRKNQPIGEQAEHPMSPAIAAPRPPPLGLPGCARKRCRSAYGSRVDDLDFVCGQPVTGESVEDCSKGIHRLATGEDGAQAMVDAVPEREMVRQ